MLKPLVLLVLLLGSGPPGEDDLARLEREATEHLRSGDYHAAERLSQAWLAAATRKADRRAMGQAHQQLGTAKSYLGDRAGALHELGQALAIRRETGPQSDLTRTLISLGAVSAQISDFESGLAYLVEAQGLAEADGNAALESYCLGNIGLIYKNMGRGEAAIQHLTRSLEIERSLGNEEGVAATLTNIANTHLENGQPTQALEVAQEALALKKRLGPGAGVAESHDSLGEIYLALGDLGHAQEHVEQALALYESAGQRRGVAGCLGNLAKIRLARGDLEGALSLAERGLRIAQEIGDRLEEREFHMDLAQLEARRGRYRAAYERLQAYVAVHDQVVGAETQRRVAELQARFDAERQQRQIDLLEKSSEIQALSLSRERLRLRFAIVVALALTGVFALLFRRYLHLLAFWRRTTRIGHYRLLEQLGSGGMGVVYRAVHVLDRTKEVAIKVIREELSRDDTSRRRLLHEGAVVDQLHHPNVVRVVERGEHDGRLYVAMELLEGETLADRIARGTPLPLRECLEVIRQLACAVERIHEQGVLHRDITPANVMLVSGTDDTPQIKLLDFGLAKSRSLTGLTATGEMMGTLFYLAPETISGQRFTSAGDVYALGVVLYETLTLARPFSGDLPVDVIRQILETDPLPPSRLRPEIPPAVDDLVLAAMQRRPDARPNVTTVRERIERQLAGL